MLKGRNRIARIVYLPLWHDLPAILNVLLRDIWRSVIGSFVFCRNDMLPEQCTRCDKIAFANFVAAISHTNSNQFEFMRLIAATKFFRGDYDFHKINHVSRCELLRRLVPATCCSYLSQRVTQLIRIEAVFEFVWMNAWMHEYIVAF